MIQLTTLPVATPLDGIRATGANQQISADFALALAAIGVSGDGEIAVPEVQPALTTERQEIADPGKTLPLAAIPVAPLSEDDLQAIAIAKPVDPAEAQAKPAESDGRKRKRGASDVPAELLVQPQVVPAQVLPPVAPPPAPPSSPPAAVAPAVFDAATPAQAPNPAPQGSPDLTQPKPLEQTVQTVPETLAAADPAPGPIKADAQSERHVDARLAFKAPAQPLTVAPTLEVSPIARPAAETFAAAMFATTEPAKRRPDDAQPDALSLAVADTKPAPIAIHAPSESQHAPLDTRRDDWMGKMIEQIETMQEDGGVRETRMRLMPEALGRVDVTIRHDGDKVSVQLTAETPAARALLAESAPKLAELAQARGLNLDSGAGHSGTGAGPSRRNDATLVEPTKPVSTTSDEIETSGPTDGRIA